MKRFDARILWGALLILGGISLLFANYGILKGLIGVFWALLFAAGGAVFLYVFLTNREHWWAIIPGFTLLGLAANIGLGALFPRVAGLLGGSVFLGAAGLSFLIVYVTGTDRWWAIIPGGVMMTLALVSGISAVFEGLDAGGVFFLGLGLTFGVLYFVPTPQGRQKWASIPAIVLLIIGAAISIASIPLIWRLWPVALILVGLALLVRLFVPRRTW
jgi:hypothetical protein